MIAEMWSTYISHAYTLRGEVQLKPHDVAMLMDMVKTARSVYGYSEDNFKDKAGYSSLAAMLHPDAPNREPAEERKSLAELMPRVNYEFPEKDK
jgi:hypothetical protein